MRTAAAGNTVTLSDYRIADNNVMTGNYYRVAHHDADETVAYINVLHADGVSPESLKI